MKAQISPVHCVQSIKPHRILAPTRDLNRGPPPAVKSGNPALYYTLQIPNKHP